MKTLIISLTSLLVLASSPAFAFINSQEERLLVEAINQVNPAQIHVENIRCSLRNRLCIVKLEAGSHQRKAGCMIERISEVSELYTENVDKATGKTLVSLSPYAAEVLNHCVSQIL